MGIDFGERYIGLAIKKENLSVPYAHKVIDQTKSNIIKELEKTIASLESQYKAKEEELNAIRITLIKAKGAQDILNQIEEGIEVDDTKSTD